ncbi:MAG: ABC transporter permease [Lachnospiraceae bacterium]|nr:ABC transporter permease [Lachnospiraceae bacterium]
MIDMFIHNFKYAFKTLFRNKPLIFWTYAFPLIMATLFNLAFSDIENKEKLDIINIAIVDNEEFQQNIVFNKAYESLSDEKNEDRLFETKYVTRKEAKKLLNDGEIDGYLELKDGKPVITVVNNGINQTVIKYVAEEVAQAIFNQEEVKIKDISSSNLSYTMIEFYTLIAMTCLYGGILGTYAINMNLANMSSKGKRVSVAPVPKIKVILSSVCASYLVQIIGLMLLFAYTGFVIKVDYGSNLLMIIVLALVGSLAGLTLGVAVSSVFKTSQDSKTGIIIAITMLGCFLSGMMGITLKYYIDKSVPIINKLNPASMITDGYYSLYYYETLDRFKMNIVSLLVFSVIMITISVVSIKRQKYETV